jgi:hypothetical protein
MRLFAYLALKSDQNEQKIKRQNKTLNKRGTDDIKFCPKKANKFIYFQW